MPSQNHLYNQGLVQSHPFRILAACKMRRGQREKGWAWLPVLGVLLVAAAVGYVAAVGLLKNFGGRGNDAAISSGQTDEGQRRSPSDAKLEPQVAEAEPTEESAFPNTPENDEARERAWENENRAGFRELRSGLWEINLAVDTSDFGSCTQVMRQLAGCSDRGHPEHLFGDIIDTLMLAFCSIGEQDAVHERDIWKDFA